MFEWFERPSFQIEVPQIIIHKASQPDVLVYFFDATACPAKTWLKLIFFLPKQKRPQRVTTMVLSWSG